MKRIFLLIVISIFTINMYADVKHYTIYTHQQYCIEDSMWTKEYPCNISMDVDDTNRIIYIGLQNQQEYRCIRYQDWKEHDNSVYLRFDCIDKDGFPCQVFMLIYENETREMRIRYNNLVTIYKYKIDGDR